MRIDKRKIINFIKKHYIINSCISIILITAILDLIFGEEKEIIKPFNFLFYGIYGFISCAAMVFAAKLMGLILLRKESYYKEKSDNI